MDDVTSKPQLGGQMMNYTTTAAALMRPLSLFARGFDANPKRCPCFLHSIHVRALLSFGCFCI